MLTACIFALLSADILFAESNTASIKYSFGKMNDEIYVQVTGRMIHYDRVYRRKYQINDPDPKANRTAEGVSNAYKYENSMRQSRKSVLAKYDVTGDEFANYADALDTLSSTSDGKKKRQRLLDRAAQIAKTLAEK